MMRGMDVRHLNYPAIPRQPKVEGAAALPMAIRRIEKLEARLKLLEKSKRAASI